jgi:hypothetical protein
VSSHENNAAVLIFCLQFYERLHPESANPAEAPIKDIAAAIADEVAGLKDTEAQLFTYNKTNIHGLVYLTMKEDAGKESKWEMY